MQAEDGTRSGHVTGVQTCALPIYMSAGTPADPAGPAALDGTDVADGTEPPAPWQRLERRTVAVTAILLKIGRASCRESVTIEEVAHSLRQSRVFNAGIIRVGKGRM